MGSPYFNSTQKPVAKFHGEAATIEERGSFAVTDHQLDEQLIH